MQLTIDISPDSSGTRPLRDFIRSAARALGMDDALQHHLITALSEFCNNVSRHAQPAATRIRVQFNQSAGEWIIDIMDDGGEFNPITSGKFKPMTNDNALRSSGMGIPLIATCFPDCTYTGKSSTQDHFNHFCIPLHQLAHNHG